MNQRRKGILLNYATMLVKLIVGLIYTPFLLSRIGESEYGILSIANSFIIFITILDCGFGQTLIRYQTKNTVNKDEHAKAIMNGLFLKLYTYVSLIAMAVGAAIMFLYPVFAKRTLSNSEIILFQKVFLILLVNTVLTFPLRIFSADLQVKERFGFFKGVNLVLVVLRYVCMTILLLNNYHVLSLAVVISVTSLLTQLFYMVYCIHKLSFKVSFQEIDTDVKNEILTFSFFILINLIVDFLYDNTDKLLLGAIKGTAAVTVYSIGVSFYTYFKLLSTSISGVYMPKVVTLYETDKDSSKLSKLFTQVSQMQILVLMVFINAYIVFGKHFLKLWVGDGFDAAYLVGILIMVPSVIPLSQNLGQSILRAMNLHRYRSYMYLTIAILNLIITVPLSFKMGPVGAALGTCIATILGEIIYLNLFYSIKAKIQLGAYWKFFACISLLCLVLDCISYYICNKYLDFEWSWLTLICAVSVFSLVYFLATIIICVQKSFNSTK